jgi:FkbM family methyltransferase
MCAKLKRAAARTPLATSKRFRRLAAPSSRADMLRIGTDYGGWSVPDSLINDSWICYCGGIGTDVSFDLGFIERYGCPIYAFDPTPSCIPHAQAAAARDKRFRFYPWGLWSTDQTLRFYAPYQGDSNFSLMNLEGTQEYIDVKCRSIPSIMRELGHERVDFLKLDIEGAEYEVLRCVGSGEVRPVVICVEFHKTEGRRVRRMAETLDALRNRGYVPVCLDGFDVTLVSSDAQGGRVTSAELS